jgi:hypothetical protein
MIEGIDREMGERARDCPSWIWMEGMVVWDSHSRWRIIGVEDDWIQFDDIMGSGQGTGRRRANRLVPDFSDAATRGCLLDLLRRAWKNEGLCVYMKKGATTYWRILDSDCGGAEEIYSNESEVDCMIMALEDAP